MSQMAIQRITRGLAASAMLLTTVLQAAEQAVTQPVTDSHQLAVVANTAELAELVNVQQIWVAQNVESEVTAARRAVQAERLELEAARRELREAARKVAEIRRAGARGDGEQVIEKHFRFAYSRDDDNKLRLGLVMGPQDDQGVAVLSVTPESPAQKAGLRSGDVIVTVNGKKLDKDEADLRLHQFFELTGELEADKAVAIGYQREGEKVQTVEITPEELAGFHFMPFAPNVDVDTIIEGVSEAMPMIHFDEHSGGPGLHQFIRMRRFSDFELTALDDDLGEYFGSTQGLLVLGVPAMMKEQLQRGDIILQIDGREPRDVSHAFRILRSYETGESVNLSLLRHKRREEISIVIPEDEEQEVIFKREFAVPPAPPAPPGAERSVALPPHTVEAVKALIIST